MRSIFVLFLFSFSVKSQDNATLSDLDSIFARLLAFGDKNNTFPVDKIEAKELCDRYKNLALVVANCSHPSFLLRGVGANPFKTESSVCQLYEKSPNEMALFAAEVNSKSEQLSDIYQKYINFGANIGQGENGEVFCETSLIYCFFLKYYGEINDQLSVSSQMIFKKIFQFYLDFTNQFEVTSVCNWSDIPVASHIQFRSVALSMLNGVFKCFNKSNN